MRRLARVIHMYVTVRTLENLVQLYFSIGLINVEILHLLTHQPHHITSIRTLKGCLYHMDLSEVCDCTKSITVIHQDKQDL